MTDADARAAGTGVPLGADNRDGRDRAARRDAAEGRAGRASRSRGDGAPGHSAFGERFIAGVPARIMRPRLVFIGCLIALVCFGLLMVYSASSVEALKENDDSLYYLKRQALAAGIGGIAAALLAFGRPFNLRNLRSGFAAFLYVPIVLTLLVVVPLGLSSGGAVRWINLGPLTFQPSEFAKPLIILFAADLLAGLFQERALDSSTFALRFAGFVALPIALILIEPDYGSTLIIGATVFVMAVLAGMSRSAMAKLVPILLVMAVFLFLTQSYRVTRFLVAQDPWADPYDTGYQATLAIMAFASGGLTGRGIGNSTMKYSYLPEAHNDYILSVIGEEVGFIGLMAFFAVFALLIWSAFRIAKESPSPYGRLIASGCGFILAAQFLVNALGVVAAIPMTGKTMPFISYGGSSMIASLILAGLVIRVSCESYDGNPYRAARAGFSVMGAQGGSGAPAAPAAQTGDDVSDHLGRSTAGEARLRGSGAPARDGVPVSSRAGFSVYDGGAAGASGDSAPGTRRPSTLRTARRPADDGAGGFERVNLNADPAARLRTRRDEGFERGSGGPRDRGDGRRGRR